MVKMTIVMLIGCPQSPHRRGICGHVFTQIMMFSLKKIDNLRARKREQEEKGTTNSV